ncbi:dihydroorotate dehydrogenase (fumarate) [Geosmithia morbida]|uniref:Dihydroorotate oxidase n=1 Tax=Geosmithia morbida TaxID=1094350 RepID=A0A9P4YSL3_9HYPO|nr:dihydroorotate dehydrogenase (fumarate) [Geosmithia morbida]KAF4121029.1 dihydroorotate dehydrogenase (fumarate) [Geosmithia morbida]
MAGFNHQPLRHRFVLFDPSSTQPGKTGTHSLPEVDDGHPRPSVSDETPQFSASLNNLGYSPVPLTEYLDMLRALGASFPGTGKPVILSVTGTSEEAVRCYETVVSERDTISFPLAVEINLSCPNIPGAPPVAYDAAALTTYLRALPVEPVVPVGIKTPPYTHTGQYDALFEALMGADAARRLSFITSTNTLGSCLVLDPELSSPALPSGGIGGMAGPPLHPLSLGNVATIRAMLDKHADLAHLTIIGVGGVSDGHTYRNMRSVGATAVALATGLGRHGTAIFSSIEKDIGSKW